MTSILTHNNHELHKIVRERIEAQYPLSFIAQELDVTTDDLVHWLLDVYRAPKRKPYQNKGAGPLAASRGAGGNGWSLGEQARRHAARARQREGARKALGE